MRLSLIREGEVWRNELDSNCRKEGTKVLIEISILSIKIKIVLRKIRQSHKWEKFYSAEVDLEGGTFAFRKTSKDIV